ncbi:MAG: thioredoxin domain-containing protein [Alphaproteobacteria bacterium]|nr:thioredoxin domain-containing protein [Alphaproteobacteria bacterium]
MTRRGRQFGIRAVVLAVLAAASAAGAGEEPGTNRLSGSRSPYLLLHADNPVDWYPWGPEALAAARAENLPIFLSVGYSTCYWCHVAERTLYSDPEIAALMNRWFVNVKVDSEQRPDIDRVYMLARQLLTGQGGWPNNLFLTPDLKPFFAGSYFPPQTDGPGWPPSFPDLLAMVHEAWEGEPESLLAAAESLFQAMREAQRQMAGAAPVPITPGAWRESARAALAALYDSEYGGFTMPLSPLKFPRPPTLALLLADHRHGGGADSLAMATGTLDAMALGGINDQLAGGFHRYSTDRGWSIPHFEKMLTDNAQLLGLYAEAYAIGGNALHRRTAIAIGEFLLGPMALAEGGFATALDAQVSGREGASYLWTHDQIAALLGPVAASRFFETYTLVPVPVPAAAESPPGPEGGVIRVRRTGDGGARDLARRLEALAPERATLRAARDTRPQPDRDDKIVVAQNGLAIAGLASAGAALDRPDYTAAARRAAARIWTLAFDPETGALAHQIFRGTAGTTGDLADYALLGLGLSRLHQTTGEAVWRRRAARLGESLLARFRRPDGGLASAASAADLLLDLEDVGDEIHASGTSAAIELLLALSAGGGAPAYAEAAVGVLGHISSRVDEHPELWSAALVAMTTHRQGLEGALAATATDGPPTSDADAGGFRMPDSADHITATGTAESGPDHDQATITLAIEDSWHINANPASLDFLIPTTVVFDRFAPARIAYPAPVRFAPAWMADGLDVYEGRVRLIARFAPGTFAGQATVDAVITAQACNETTCLAPADLPVAIPLD